MILLDTCTLLWWTLDPDHLSKNASKICLEIDRRGAYISSVTIWEIGIKIKKGTLDIHQDIESYLHRLKQLGTIEIIPVDENIWIKNILLPWEHPDPADRTIVATAMIRDLAILTKDRIIRNYYDNVIW